MFVAVGVAVGVLVGVGVGVAVFVGVGVGVFVAVGVGVSVLVDVGVEVFVGVKVNVGPGVGVLVGVGIFVGVQPSTMLVTAFDTIPPVSTSLSQAWLTIVEQPLLTTAEKNSVPAPPAGTYPMSQQMVSPGPVPVQVTAPRAGLEEASF